MFIISLTYKKSLEEVDNLLERHVVFLKEQYALDNFIASGRKNPRTGGIILSSLKNKKDVEQIIQSDPFYKNGIADYNLTEFIPSMTSDKLSWLLDD